MFNKVFAPTSASGSFLYSVLAHVTLAVGIVWVLGFHMAKKAPVEQYLDLGYQTFDAPPPPAPTVQKVRRSNEPDTPPEKTAKEDNTPKELQDEKSDIAGTQVAKKETNLGSENNGTAEAVPYYKIKPKYPKAAELAGITGHVDFEIDVNEDGTVANIRVVGGENLNTFEREARRALEQWKYKPFVDATGKVVKKEHHFVTIAFKLEDIEPKG